MVKIQLDFHRRGQEGCLRRIIRLESLIARSTRTLSDCEVMLSMQEIPLDPADISEVRPHEEAKLLPYGDLSKLIFRTIRANDGRATTTQLLDVFMKETDQPETAKKYVKRRLNIRLWRMVANGQVRAEPAPQWAREKVWLIDDPYRECTRKRQSY